MEEPPPRFFSDIFPESHADLSWIPDGQAVCASVEVHLTSCDDPRRELDALEREPRPRRRLDRFSLIVDTGNLKPSELGRFTEYAAECGVEDLNVEVWRGTHRGKLKFHLPLSSPLLARLSLRSIGISTLYHKRAQPFRALQVIRLHSVSIDHKPFTKMMALCPSLLTLDLRHCNFDFVFYSVAMPPNLRSLTVVCCNGIAKMNFAPSLRSFRYRGLVAKGTFPFLPLDTVLSDLYISFEFHLSVSQQYSKEKLYDYLRNDFSGLNVLTIDCSAFQVVSSMPNLNLHSLRELQLLGPNLADLYVFLKTCHCQCPNLERLFLQFWTYHHHEPMEDSTDEVTEEPSGDGLDNLLTVLFLDFDWWRAEVQLVSFLLRKASSLRKMLIVSPHVTLLDLPDVQEANILLVKEALATGKIMLSNSDDAATQPYHSERLS